MIERILSSGVSACETRQDPVEEGLFPDEEALLVGAVEKRRREFAAGRVCARAALGQLGYPAVPVLSGSRGEPLWPTGVVGSITHCDGYRAAAVARSGQIATIGIDAEPHLALPEGLLGRIAGAEERVALVRLGSERPQVHWDRLLFSAKESVYKAWYPLAGRGLSLKDISIALDPLAGTFVAQLPMCAPAPADRSPSELSGGWTVAPAIKDGEGGTIREGLILTAVLG
jgi:4'-phosphopantetheinyl transferase EntD